MERFFDDYRQLVDDGGPGSVVTGQRLADTEQALEACIARHCSPDKDVDASLAHAESQFIAGQYWEARRTLAKAIGRDRKYAKTYPVPVADLLRANARIAIHLGEGDAYRLGMVDSLSALKAGLDDNDLRVLNQKLEVADSYARLGRVNVAVPIYADVARKARTLRYSNVEGHALFRTAMLYGLLADVQPAYRSSARRAVATIVATTDPALAPFREAVKLLQARLADHDGDHQAIDQLIAGYRAQTGGRQMLLYSPPIEDQNDDRPGQGGLSMTNKMATQSFDNQWVDISFWITPDGTVTDAGILRQSATLNTKWLNPILTSITGRRYSPVRVDPGVPGQLRVERYTLTSLLERRTGSRIRVHSARPRIEMLDLTAEPPLATGG